MVLETESKNNIEHWKHCMKYPRNNKNWYSDMSRVLMVEYQLMFDIICEEFNLERREVTGRMISTMTVKDALTPVTYEKVINKFF